MIFHDFSPYISLFVKEWFQKFAMLEHGFFIIISRTFPDGVRQAIKSTCTQPAKFRDIILRRFLKQKDACLKICEDNCLIDGAPMNVGKTGEMQ